MGRMVAAFVVLAMCGVSRADDVGAARDHYRKGTRAYDLGHYDEAVKEYEAAYRAKDDPALLFNIAQAYRLSGDLPNAIRTYRSFLRRVPEAPNRAEVDKRIIELQKAIDEQAKAKEGPAEGTLAPAGTQAEPKPQQPESKPSEPSPSPSVTPAVAVETQPASTRGRGLRIAGLSMIGIGAASLIVGGTFVGLAKSANDDVNSPSNNRFDPSAEDRRNTYQAVDVAFFAIGGVAAATGITIYFLGRRAAHRVAALPSATPLRASTTNHEGP